MPHLEYFLVSESISIDQNRNTVSLFHVLEERYFESLPGRFPSLVISTLWDVEEGERGQDFDGKILVYPPCGGEIKVFPFTFKTEQPVPRQRVILEMTDWRITSTGTMRFEVYLGEDRRASHKILINLLRDHPTHVEASSDSG